MRIAVFGATGGTGAQVLGEGLRRGHEMVAVARSPERVGVEGARVVRGDVLRPEDWAGELEGVDAVVSALGVSPKVHGTTVYSAGTQAIAETMDRAGVRRLEVLSAAPSLPRKQWQDYGALAARVVFPLLHRAFGAAYADMHRMEEFLDSCPLDWTVFRPPRLVDGPAWGHVTLHVDEPRPVGPSARLTRADLAAALLDGLTAPELIRRHVDVLARPTTSGTGGARPASRRDVARSAWHTMFRPVHEKVLSWTGRNIVHGAERPGRAGGAGLSGRRPPRAPPAPQHPGCASRPPSRRRRARAPAARPRASRRSRPWRR